MKIWVRSQIVDDLNEENSEEDRQDVGQLSSKFSKSTIETGHMSTSCLPGLSTIKNFFLKLKTLIFMKQVIFLSWIPSEQAAQRNDRQNVGQLLAGPQGVIYDRWL